MVTNPGLLSFVDTLNIWGLTLIGLSLMVGLLSRWGSIAGACLLTLYYLFHPPLVGLEYSKPPEGSYLIIDKNLVEACALFVLAMFPTSHITGLDRFLNKD
jgi:thiosulfate dehydrogenase [quinone] large subunit